MKWQTSPGAPWPIKSVRDLKARLLDIRPYTQTGLKVLGYDIVTADILNPKDPPKDVYIVREKIQDAWGRKRIRFYAYLEDVVKSLEQINPVRTTNGSTK